MAANKPPEDQFNEAVQKARGARLSAPEIAYLLITAVRIPAVFMTASDRITIDLFDGNSEGHLILFWRASLAVAAAHGSFPADPSAAADLLSVRCNAELSNDPTRSFYNDSIIDTVFGQDGMINSVKTTVITQETEREVFALLGRFITERYVSDPLRRALLGMSESDALANPVAVLELVEKRAMALSGMQVDAGDDAVVDSDDFMPVGARTIPTGVGWLDDYMGGGQAVCETYFILGGTGSGKTALGVQIALEGARLQAALSSQGVMGGWWYYFTYELTKAQLRERIYAYGAKVSRASLNVPQGQSVSLSTATSLKPYEVNDPYINPPGVAPRGEKERVAAFRAELAGVRSKLVIVDYSGEIPGQGRGGVMEIARYLKRQVHMGRTVAGVVIDYAGICVQRYVAENRLTADAEYPLLNGFGDAVRMQVSIPFKTSVWIMGQLHGDVGSRAPGVALSHRDARGAKNIADNADFAFNIGNHDPHARVVVSCSKCRRSPGHEVPAITQFDGRFGVFKGTNGAYVLDPATKQIVSKSELDLFSGGSSYSNSKHNPMGGI